MQYIDAITDHPNQTIRLTLPETQDVATLTLRYSPQQYAWYMDLAYKTFLITNRKVFASPHMTRQFKNVLPFGLGCFTLDGTDPYFLNDFSTGRSGLMIITQSEMENFETILSGLKSA